MGRLTGKVAIVTGGASGIGRATVEKFLAEGARVAIWDVNEAKATTVLHTFQAGSNLQFYNVNTADAAACKQAAEKVVTDFGRLDILINNAGITRDATTKKMTSEQWNQVIDVNLSGVFNCTQAVYPYMAEQEWGRIISASSVVGLYGNFGQANYAATKAGVIAMSKVWAKEFGRYNITANAVAPGFIHTEMMDTIPEKVLDNLKAKTPLQRLGKVEEVAALYAFLASDEAAFITGSVYSIDGGITL